MKINRGQTLVEIIIAVGIIVVVFVGCLSLAAMTIKIGRITKEKNQALNLVQEGIEGIRNIRDTYWLDEDKGADKDARWTTFLNDFSGDVNIEYDETEGKWKKKTEIDTGCIGDECFKEIIDGKEFQRTISITDTNPSDPLNKKKVSVTVSWDNGSQTTAAVSQLTNWVGINEPSGEPLPSSVNCSFSEDPYLLNPGADDPVSPRINIDSSGYPHVTFVRYPKSASSNIGYVYKTGSGWQSLPNAEGSTKNILVAPFLLNPVNDNPYVAWIGLPRGNMDTMFTKWDPSANGGAGGWTKADGTLDRNEIYGFDNVSDNNSYSRRVPLFIFTDLSADRNPRIIWIDGGEVLYSSYDLGVWSEPDCISDGSCIPVSVNSIPTFKNDLNNDKVVIAWNAWENDGYNVHYASSNHSLGSWSVEIIDADSYKPSVDIDSSGNSHISYLKKVGGFYRCFYTKWTGSEWTAPITVYTESSGNPINDNKIEIDSFGNPHIFINEGIDMYHTKWTGSEWTTPVNISGTVDLMTMPTTLDYIIKFDSNGMPHVIFRRDTTEGCDLFYTRFISDGWTEPCKIVGVNNDYASRPWDMTMDSNNDIHVVYKDYSTNELFYGSFSTN